MEKISIVVPCYNEEKSVHTMHEIITHLFQNQLSQYDYELIFHDDYSTDNTREELRKICLQDQKVKAVFNAKNFGFNRNVFYALTQATGDLVFMVFGDLQDPPELLPQFIAEWEKGSKVVIGQKLHSDENKFVYWLRSLFYHVINKLSSVPQVQHFNGYGLYDKMFINAISKINDPNPYLKGIVGEFAMDMNILNYDQKESVRGKSNFNFSKYYDVAMLGVTSYTKTLMRISTFIGGLLGVLSLVLAIFVFINKLIHWDTYPMGIPTIIVGVFLIGAVQLFFTGILGEYILSINTRTLQRPLVIPGERLNFDDDKDADKMQRGTTR